MNSIKLFLGSSLALSANGLGVSRATSSLVAHFALQNTASNSAEKKNRPREGVATIAQNPNSENWRCLFENIRTEITSGLGGRKGKDHTPLPPASPCLPDRNSCYG